MDKTCDLLRLARALSQAASREEWEALGRLDGELAALLLQLGAPCNWSNAQQQAVGVLRQAHQDAWRSCQRESESLAQRLAGMHASRDGWLAYAMNDAHEGDHA